jgi:hypothetical protein
VEKKSSRNLRILFSTAARARGGVWASNRPSGKEYSAPPERLND